MCCSYTHTHTRFIFYVHVQVLFENKNLQAFVHTASCCLGHPSSYVKMPIFYSNFKPQFQAQNAP